MFNKLNYYRREKRIEEIKRDIEILEDLGRIYGCDPEFEQTDRHPYSSKKIRQLRDELFVLTHS